MKKKKTREYARELFKVFKPFIIIDLDGNGTGYNYHLSEDATPEAIEADREYRTFAKDLPPIR